MSKLAVFLVFASGLALAQQTRPSIVEAPLDFAPEGVFGKATVGRPGSSPSKEGSGSLADRLAVQFHRDLAGQHPGLTVPLKATWMDVTSKARRLDWDKSDVALGKLAEDANTLYALYVSVSFGVVPGNGKGESHGILMVARVAHRQGRPVGEPVTVFEPRAGRQMSEVFRGATAKLFASLNLVSLKLSLPVETTAPVALVPPPPPSPPPEEIRNESLLVPHVELKKSEPSVLRLVGYGGLFLGGAAVIAGVATFFAAPEVRKDATGGVLEADLGSVRPMRNMQATGVGLMIAGGILAAAGGGLALWAPEQKAVRVSVAPSSGGVTLVVGGAY